MRGCGESQGERGRVICLDQVSDTPQRSHIFGDASAGRSQAHRAVSAAASVRRFPFTPRGVDKRVAAVISLRWLGARRAASFAGSIPTPEELGALHRHAGRRPQASRAHGEIADGAALRHCADPRASAGKMWSPSSIQELPSRNGAEHVRFPRGGCRGQYFAATFAATAQRGRFRDAYRAVDTELFRHAGQPTDLHLFAETDHFMFAEENERVRKVIFDWLKKYFPAKASGQSAAENLHAQTTGHHD